MNIGLIQDPNGDFSAMRLIFLIGFLWLFFADSYLIINKVPLSDITTFTGVTGGILAALKVGQTQIEKNKEPIETTN